MKLIGEATGQHWMERTGSEKKGGLGRKREGRTTSTAVEDILNANIYTGNCR